MEELRSPDKLDELDRRVYDLAIQHIPLAEMAVRLGVPVGQANDKLQRLFARLGVADRAELRALAAEPEPAALAEAALPAEPMADEQEYVIGAEAEAEGQTPAPRRLSRRAFVGASAAVAVLGVGGVAAFGSRRRGSSNGGLSDDSAFPPLGGRLPAPITALGGSGEAFVTKTWHDGETVDWNHGLFFMPVAPVSGEGVVTGYQFLPSATEDQEWRNYRTFGDGRFVTTASNRTGEGRLIDRNQPALSWSWGQDYELVAAHGNGAASPVYLVFLGTRAGVEGHEQWLNFVTLDGTSAAATFETRLATGVGFEPPAVLQSRDGPRVAVIDGAHDSPSVWVFDLTAPGEPARVALRPEAEGSGSAITARSLRPYEGGVIAQWQTATNGRGEAAVEYYSQLVSWRGEAKSPRRDDVFGRVYAPNGLWSLSETGQGRTTPEGEPTGWPSVELARGSVAFRVRSGTMFYGDEELPGGRWLAGGWGFVVAVRAGGFGQYGYAIVPATVPGALTVLPPAPVPGSGWSVGLLPSPWNDSLFAYARTRVFNMATDTWQFARLADGVLPDPSVDPWSGGRAELVFGLPGFVSKVRTEPMLLAPKFEQPPFNDLFRFVVDVDDEGLNVRAEPDSGADSRAVAYSGDVLQLAGEPGATTIVRKDAHTWVRVRTASGVEGWANSYWLAWAD